MIYCSNCGLANRDGSRFCNECGVRLGFNLPCPACGGANLSTSRFCSFCGSRLAFNPVVASEPAPPAEARIEPGQSELAPKTDSFVSPAEPVLAPHVEAEDANAVPTEVEDDDREDDSFPTVTGELRIEPLNLRLEEEPIQDGKEAVAEPSPAIGDDPVVQEELAPVEPKESDLAPESWSILTAPIVEESADSSDVDDQLPAWLAEVEHGETANDPASVTEIEQLLEAAPNVEKDNILRPLPWERPDGIAAAKSVTERPPSVRFDEPGESISNSGTLFASALSSSWQPLPVDPTAEGSRKAVKRKPRAFRRILVYLMVAALIALAAVVASKVVIPLEIASFFLGGD